jgi:hypothetical protein
MGPPYPPPPFGFVKCLINRQMNNLTFVVLKMADFSLSCEDLYGCVCVFVCSDITLERLERCHTKLVHILLYVCVRILCMLYIYIYLSPKHQFPKGIWMIHVVEEIKLLLLLGNRFQPNLVHIVLYVCVRILRMLYIYIYIYIFIS